MTTILVVDDSATDRRLAGGLLEKAAEWDVIYATDGSDALNQLELHVPDIVVTDLQMPVMNGLELVQAAKRQYPLVPIILMTAKGSEEIAVEALQVGAASYVPKRLLAQELIDTIRRVAFASGEQRGEARLMNRMARAECNFVLENDLLLLPAAINFLQQTASSMRIVDDTDRLRLGVALEEALLNAYYHGNLEVGSDLREVDYNAYYELARKRCDEEPYRGRRIYLDAELTKNAAVFVVRDEGAGFDPSELPDATDPANLDRPCGRGVLLMKTFMDEVTYNDIGNQVTLVKRRMEQPAAYTASEVS